MSFGLIELLGAVIGIVILIATYAKKNTEKNADNNESYQVLTLDEFSSSCRLDAGAYKVTLIRQSGFVYRELGEFLNAEEAVRGLIKSFRKAEIEDVRLNFISSTEIEIQRAFYNFKGRATGKKLGGGRISMTYPLHKQELPWKYVQILPSLSVAVESVQKKSSDNTYFFNFGFRCDDCGGYILEVDEDTKELLAKCKACYREFEKFELIKQKANEVATEFLVDNRIYS